MPRAVAALRPNMISALRGVIDPDRDDGDVLDDQSLLLTTRTEYGGWGAEQGSAILTSYGPELVESHHDARGVLLFPESFYPNARTYDGVIVAVEALGVWVPPLVPDRLQPVELARRKKSVLRAHKRSLSGSPVLASFRDGLPLPSKTGEESFERLQEMLNQPHVVAALARVSLADVLLIRARRAPPRRALFRGRVSVLQHHALPDGTAMIVVAVKGTRKREVVAHMLATSTRVQSWLDEHDDPRGVPYLLSRDTELLARARSYEEALKLAEEVTFVRPQRREEQTEERKERLRCALFNDSLLGELK